MKQLLLLLVVLFLISCSNHAGGGTEGGNVDLAGTIESSGTTVTNARIYLFPKGYHPYSSKEQTILDTVIDASGSFRFSSIDTGLYTVRIESADKAEGFIAELHITDTIKGQLFTMQPVGGVTILLDKAIDTAGRFCYVPNTDIALPLSGATVDQSGNYLKLEFPTLPPGEIDTFQLWNSATASDEEVVAQDITVESGKTNVVGESFNWVPINKGNSPLSSGDTLNKMANLKGELWFASSNGFFNLKDGVWTNHATDIKVATYYDVILSERDNVLVGTASGEFVYYHNSWLSDTVPYKSIGTNPVYSMYKESSGQVWFAQMGNGVVTTKGNESKSYSKTELLEKAIISFAQSESGPIWMLDDVGALIIFDGEEFIEYTGFSKPVTKIVGGAGGEMWLISSERLYKLNGEAWDQQLSEEIHDIAFDRESGKLFATTDDTKELIIVDSTVERHSFVTEISGDDFRLTVSDGQGYIYTNDDFISFTYMY